ncbi:MAG: hypothetical protein QXG63_06030 [Nitrososphaerales archaeon]
MSKKSKQYQNAPTSVEQVVQPVLEIPEEPKVEFDAWYALRKSKIPSHHHKEIIKADFAGRKVPNMATMAEFDAALEQYGIKLT